MPLTLRRNARDPRASPRLSPSAGANVAGTQPARPGATIRRRDPALDGLRGVAILLVFLYHYGGGLRSPHRVIRAFGALTQTGWTGVVLFFALSGFLITGSLWDSRTLPHHLRNFYLHRALRIAPLYYLTLVLAAVAAIGASGTFAELQPLALYAAFLQNVPRFVPAALLTPPPLPLFHLWSLAVEEQFYLLWPLLLLGITRLRGALALSLAIFVASWLFRVLFLSSLGPGLSHFSPWTGSLPTQAGALALGAALALSLRSPWAFRVERFAAPTCLAGLLVYGGVCVWERSAFLSSSLQFTLGLPAVSLAATALLAKALQPSALRRAASVWPLRALGRISYGFYVFHILLEPLYDVLGAHLAHAASGQRYQAVRLPVAFFGTLLVAWLSFHALEEPLLRWKRRFPLPSALPDPSQDADSPELVSQ